MQTYLVTFGSHHPRHSVIASPALCVIEDFNKIMMCACTQLQCKSCFVYLPWVQVGLGVPVDHHYHVFPTNVPSVDKMRKSCANQVLQYTLLV